MAILTASNISDTDCYPFYGVGGSGLQATSQGNEGRTAYYNGAKALRDWRDGSEYIKRIIPMVVTYSPALPDLDMIRRRVVWEGVTPIAFLFAGIVGVACSSTGAIGTACIMAATLVVTAIIGRLVWPA